MWFGINFDSTGDAAMKIALAVTDQGENAEVSLHAARAPFYWVYNESGTCIDIIANPYCAVDHGAAPRAAQLLQEHDIAMLVAGEFGGRIIAELEKRNIVIVQDTGPVSRVIEKIIA